VGPPIKNQGSSNQVDRLQALGYNRIMKDIKQLEKEIIKSLEININVNWDAAENSPSEEFEMLIDHVKRLFKKYA
jgi:hypothetical protein